MKKESSFLFFTFFLIINLYNYIMIKVKIFDENHEKDLEKKVNLFLCNSEIDVVDIQFRTAISIFGEDQIYCFSAMVVYRQ